MNRLNLIFKGKGPLLALTSCFVLNHFIKNRNQLKSANSNRIANFMYCEEFKKSNSQNSSLVDFMKLKLNL